MSRCIVGTRGSALALVQAKAVCAMLGIDATITTITTKGDTVRDVPLASVEGTGFFTRELDEALLRGDIDCAVHSYKDIPTALPDGIVIAAVPQRESPYDALVGAYATLDDLPAQAVVGTSSVRRKAQVLARRPDITVADLRGNLDTRLRKLAAGQYDAILVAEAGLCRLHHTEYHPLLPTTFIPAACQGALAITARRDDTELHAVLAPLDDSAVRAACAAERRILVAMDGGCQIPAGAYSQYRDDHIALTAFIASLDGTRMITKTAESAAADAVSCADALARDLLAAGGRAILDEIRGSRSW